MARPSDALVILRAANYAPRKRKARNDFRSALRVPSFALLNPGAFDDDAGGKVAGQVGLDGQYLADLPGLVRHEIDLNNVGSRRLGRLELGLEAVALALDLEDLECPPLLAADDDVHADHLADLDVA